MSTRRPRNKLSPAAWGAIGVIGAALLTAIIGPLVINSNKIPISGVPSTNAAPTPNSTSTSTPQIISVTQVVTVTRVVEVTPTPDPTILRLETIPSRSFVFDGGSDPRFQGSGNLSINHVDMTTNQYVLNYSLPEDGSTWAGYATIFEDPVNFSPYSALEVTIQNSDNSAGFQIKLFDEAKNEVYLDVTNPPKPETKIDISAQNGIQQIKVPLRGNFNKLNLEQIRELSFIMNSGLGRGEHSLTISNIRLIK